MWSNFSETKIDNEKLAFNLLSLFILDCDKFLVIMKCFQHMETRFSRV